LNNTAIFDPVSTPTSSTPASITYVVVATDANGCTTSDNVSVAINAGVVASAGKDTTICSGVR
jgi:hypothetical protein